MTFISTLSRRSGMPAFNVGWLFTLPAVRRQRRQLANLDEAALRDLGLTKAEVAHEVNRSIWDVPATWRV